MLKMYMKKLYSFIGKFSFFSKSTQAEGKEKNFFDYSVEDREKLLRAAGREAQKEQQRVLQEYDSRFGRA